jgi:hypothetical protein
MEAARLIKSKNPHSLVEVKDLSRDRWLEWSERCERSTAAIKAVRLRTLRRLLL